MALGVDRRSRRGVVVGGRVELFDVVLLRKAAVDEIFVGNFVVTLLMLLDHRQHFALVAAAVGDIHAGDHLRFGVGGELHVEGRAKAELDAVNFADPLLPEYLSIEVDDMLREHLEQFIKQMGTGS